MSEKIIGLISEIDIKEGDKQDGSKWKRGSFVIAGDKYSTFDMGVIEFFKVGDNVEVDFEKGGDKGQFRNIKLMKKTDEQSSLQSKQNVVKSNRTDTQRMIVRQSVLSTTDRKSTRLNSSHIPLSRMPSSA